MTEEYTTSVVRLSLSKQHFDLDFLLVVGLFGETQGWSVLGRWTSYSEDRSVTVSTVSVRSVTTGLFVF